MNMDNIEELSKKQMLNINATHPHFSGFKEDDYYRYKMSPLEISPCFRFNRTQLVNIDLIAKQLGRDKKIILKFMASKVGARGVTDKLKKVFITGIHTSEDLQKIIHSFINKKIICKICFNPETEEKNNKLYCKACGNINNV